MSEDQSVTSIRLKHQQELMAIPGVTGVWNTADKILVSVREESVRSLVPLTIEGIPVQVVVEQWRTLG